MVIIRSAAACDELRALFTAVSETRAIFYVVPFFAAVALYGCGSDGLRAHIAVPHLALPRILLCAAMISQYWSALAGCACSISEKSMQ